jgi:hypothetical protein
MAVVTSLEDAALKAYSAGLIRQDEMDGIVVQAGRTVASL